MEEILKKLQALKDEAMGLAKLNPEVKEFTVAAKYLVVAEKYLLIPGKKAKLLELRALAEKKNKEDLAAAAKARDEDKARKAAAKEEIRKADKNHPAQKVKKIK